MRLTECFSSFRPHKQTQQQKRPVTRYDGLQRKVHDEPAYRRPTPDTRNTFQPQLYTPRPPQPQTFQPQPFTHKMYKPFKPEPQPRPLRLVDTKPAQRNFQQFNEDTDFDFEEEFKKFNFENKKSSVAPITDSEEERSRGSGPVLKVETRENTFDNEISQPNLKTIFDQNPRFHDAEFHQSFEPERFSFEEINKESADEKMNFKPPDLTEKLRSPIKESQYYPFLGKTSTEEETLSKQRKVKPFTHFKIADKPKEVTKRKTEPVQSYQNLENFQEIPKISAHSVVSPAPAKQSNHEQHPSFTHFKTKPSFSSLKSKPTLSRLSSKSRKPSKPTTFPPTVKSFDDLPTFTNFKTVTENPSFFTSKVRTLTTSKPFPSFINFKSQPEKRVQTDQKTISKAAPQKQKLEQETPPAEKPTTTKKPYNYQKKNFREPLKQVSKDSGEHQIIRIKSPAKPEMRPQPKQLDLSGTGFRPITSPPGKLLIQEVSKRLGQYQPSDVIFDNDQPLLTLDTVKPFRPRSNPDNFAIDVKASFNPKPRQENKRTQRLQKRLMRLPNSKFSHLLHRRPVKSNKVAVAQ